MYTAHGLAERVQNKHDERYVQDMHLDSWEGFSVGKPVPVAFQHELQLWLKQLQATHSRLMSDKKDLTNQLDAVNEAKTILQSKHSASHYQALLKEIGHLRAASEKLQTQSPVDPDTKNMVTTELAIALKVRDVVLEVSALPTEARRRVLNTMKSQLATRLQVLDSQLRFNHMYLAKTVKELQCF